MGKPKPPPKFTRLKIDELEDPQKDWLDTFRPEFVNSIGTQGRSQDSAADFTRRTIMPKFFDKYYPTSTQPERDEVNDIAYNKLYGYLQNGRRGSGKRRKAKSKRVDKTNLWANDNPDATAELFSNYRKDKGLGPDATVPVDAQRTLICDAFKALPQDVQAEYEQRAKDMRETAKKNNVLQGEERLAYARAFPGLLSQFLREAEQKAGVLVMANVAYPIEDTGTLEVTSIVSDKVKEFKNTSGYADSMACWTDHLRGKGQTVKRDKPVEATFPDRQNENFPLIPEIDFDNPPPVTIMRKIIRAYCSAIYQRLGGGTAVPWKDIMMSHARGESTFIELQRMPENFPLIDPALMNAECALAWLKWLLRRQHGEGDKSSWFTFKVVHTPSLGWLLTRDDALSKEKITKGPTEVYELTYSGWVEKCQVGGRIKYSDESREYEDYLERQAQGSFSSSRPHLLGLPCKSRYTGVPPLPDSEFEPIADLLGKIPESESESVLSLVKVLNEMYMLLPAETKEGIWDMEGDTLRKVVGHPTILPDRFENLPTIEEFLSSWLPVPYFAPPFEDVPVSSTIPFFEKWQHRALNQSFLRHAESQTLLGGRKGTSSVVLAILKVLFNIGAVLGKLKLPCSKPSEVEGCRITNNDWKLALLWCDNWRKAIEATVEILKKTFAERTQDLAPVGATLTQPKSRSHPRAAPKPTAPVSRSPSPGPSRQARPRPRPRPPQSFYAEDKVVSPGGQDEEDLRSLTDSERNGSDMFQPPEQSESEGSTTGESKNSEDEDVSPPAKTRKGKNVAHGEKRSKPIDTTSGLTMLEDARRQYELEHGVTLSSQLSNGPVKDSRLDSHPLGVILDPRFAEPWTGSAAELVQECQTVKREAKDALRAIFSSPREVFPPEDNMAALQETIHSTNPAKSLLIVVVAQRLVWERAQSLWPTIQYQFRLFSELTRKLSHLMITVYARRQSAPSAVAKVLENHETGLRRLAYQVRFVYHELHDLGALSKEFFNSLSLGWAETGHIFSEPELRKTVDRIHLWSDQAAKIIRYHEESRQKTWEHHKENLDRHPVPVGVWYRFGNPPPRNEFEDLTELLATRIAVAQAESRDNAKAPSSTDDMRSAQSIDMGHGGRAKDDVDSVSPSEEDLQAQKLLHGGDSADASGVVEEPAGDQFGGVQESGVAGISGAESERNSSTGGDATLQAGPPTKKQQTVVKKVKKKRKLSEANTAEDKQKGKKKRVGSSGGGADDNSATGGGQRTRAGRTVKLSERARQL